MPFVLHPFAAVRNGDYVVQFQDDDKLLEGCTILPVIADDDPPLAANEKLWGPNYEVLPDNVRAYGTALPMSPEELAARPKLSFAQLMIGLVSEGWLSEAECESWLAGTLPAPVLDAINTLPEYMRFPAKAKAIRPFEILRDDTMVAMLGASQDKTPEQLDAFFQTYGAY